MERNAFVFDHQHGRRDVTCKPAISLNRTFWIALRREENIVEFLDEQFRSQKLSIVHKKKTEHSFEVSLSICVFKRCVFNPEIGETFGLENHLMEWLTVGVTTSALCFILSWSILFQPIRVCIISDFIMKVNNDYEERLI